MPMHDVQNPGGGTSESPVTPTGRSKRKATAKKKAANKPTIEKDKGVIETAEQPAETDPPPPPISTKEFDKEVQKRMKEKLKAKQEQRKLKKRVVMSKTHSVHNIFTHFPKCGSCNICMRNKAMKARCESKGAKECDALPTPVEFGDAGTLDHKVLNEDDASRDGDRNACVMLDRATYWLQSYADETKSSKATIRAMQKFYGPKIRQICKHIYSDNSEEI